MSLALLGAVATASLTHSLTHSLTFSSVVVMFWKRKVHTESLSSHMGAVKRRVSLYWAEKAGLLLDYLQVYAVLW
jgi:hypothetical protein